MSLKRILDNMIGTKKDKKRSLTQSQKIYIWENKSHTCVICGKPIKKYSDCEFDHRKCYKNGGLTGLTNCGLSHRQCNRLKGIKTLKAIRKEVCYEGICYE